MFLNPRHLSGRGEPYDHEWSTRQMRCFVKGGLKNSRGNRRFCSDYHHLIGTSLLYYRTQQFLLIAASRNSKGIWRYA